MAKGQIKQKQATISQSTFESLCAKKNPTMSIWLGKQYLKQRDNIEVEHDAKNGVIDELIGALNKAKESK